MIVHTLVREMLFVGMCGEGVVQRLRESDAVDSMSCSTLSSTVRQSCLSRSDETAPRASADETLLAAGAPSLQAEVNSHATWSVREAPPGGSAAHKSLSHFVFALQA